MFWHHALCTFLSTWQILDKWWLNVVFAMDLLQDPGILHIYDRMWGNSVDTFPISLRWSAAGPSLVSNFCCLKIAHLLFVSETIIIPLAAPLKASNSSAEPLCLYPALWSKSWISFYFPVYHSPLALTSSTYEYVHMKICLSHIHISCFFLTGRKKLPWLCLRNLSMNSFIWRSY